MWFPTKISMEELAQLQPSVDAHKQGFLNSSHSMTYSSSTCLLLAVMAQNEFVKQHIPGSILFDVADSDWPSETNIIVYGLTSGCRQALKTAMLLKDRGYQSVSYLEEGYAGWLNQSIETYPHLDNMVASMAVSASHTQLC